MGTQIHAPRNRIERDNFARAASKTKNIGFTPTTTSSGKPAQFLPAFLFRFGFLYGPISAPAPEARGIGA